MKKIPALLSLLFVFSFSAFSEDFFSVNRQKRVSPDSKVSLDFTKMNYNMASGVIFDMMVAPQKYKNKTMKIHGQFYTEVHSDKRIFAILIWDLTGCCPTGVTIVPLSSMKFPSDFPKQDEYVTVTGTLEIFEIDGEEALCLVAENWSR